MRISLTAALFGKSFDARARDFIDGLHAGQLISWQYEIDGCQVVSNGLVLYREAGQVYARFPVLDGPVESLDRPREPVRIASGEPLDLDVLQLGQMLTITGHFPRGMAASLTGRVTRLTGSALRLARFDVDLHDTDWKVPA